MALVASGTDWISLVSPRISSICMRLPPTLMPPALLISSRAISAPAQWFSPCTNAIGPRIAILRVPCANAVDARASAAHSIAERIMPPPCGLDFLVDVAKDRTQSQGSRAHAQGGARQRARRRQG